MSCQTNTTSIIPIKRKRGDTRRIPFLLLDEDDVAVDISLWTDFLLTVDPEKEPEDDTNNLFQAVGELFSDGTDGLVGFPTPGDTLAGDYFYDAQATDANGEIVTFAEGSYKLKQDITKG